jgi:nicotinamide mononucleotide transporter
MRTRMRSFLTNFGILAALFAISYATSATWIDLVGGVTGLVCAWLAAKEDILNYPVGIINIVAFFYTFYMVKLYANAVLQIVFFILTVIGWYVWLTKKGKHKVRPTRHAYRIEYVFLVASAVVGTLLWAPSLQQAGDPTPYVDALVTVLSIVAQYLMSYKVLENWYVWIFSDLLSISMFMYTHLYVTAAVYVVFLTISVGGLMVWKKEMTKNETPTVRMNVAL